VNAWSLDYEGYEPREERLREALCTLGNGYLATRGAAPEHDAGEHHYPGTYLAGVFNRLTTEVAGHLVENESMVNVPSWIPLTFRIDGGDWFDLDEADVIEHSQVLDIRQGLLVRRTTWRDAGRTTTVTQRRLVHMALPHVCGLETTITAHDWSGHLEVRSGLDGTVANTGVERYRDLASQHLELVRAEATDDETVLLVVETSQSRIRIAEAARHRARLTAGHGSTSSGVSTPELVGDGAWIGHLLAVDVDAGDQLTVEKLVAVHTSRDHAISEPAFTACRTVGSLGSFDELVAGHVLAWDHLWDRFRTDIEGHEDALRIVRLHTMHLVQTVSASSVGLDVGVPARGLHGEAYRGHIFWDELFVYPVLNLRMPWVTRSLLLYRYRRLGEARRAAREAGFEGAMFPWQSGSDGREENQTLHLNPASGRWLPDPTHRQRHIGIAIAYNVWQYYQATGDREFLFHHGAEMLLEIARFWSSITTYDRARDRYVIRGVIGPDEFHTGYPGAETEGIDNNAYTNVMAVWVLQRALETLEVLPVSRRTELTEALGMRPEERDRWEDISRKMFVPLHDGVVSQFEGYEDLEELDWVGYQERYGDIHRLDRILEAEGDDVNRYKASKQADVLMLLFLLSTEELAALFRRLGYDLPPDTLPRTIDHYLDRTSHGSTLSAVVHSWVLARSHRDQALDFFFRVLESDVADVQGGTTAEGIHLAAMTGSLDLLARCFAGIETRGDVLWLDTHWPEALGPLEMAIRYRQQRLVLRVTGEHVRVSSEPGTAAAIRVGCRGEVVELAPGESIELDT
jgi:alpha,alpha-trehalase